MNLEAHRSVCQSKCCSEISLSWLQEMLGCHSSMVSLLFISTPNRLLTFVIPLAIVLAQLSFKPGASAPDPIPRKLRAACKNGCALPDPIAASLKLCRSGSVLNSRLLLFRVEFLTFTMFGGPARQCDNGEFFRFRRREVIER